MASKNEVVNKIVKILDGKKGRDIEVIDISALTTMTEYFIIVTGGSDTQVKALCDNLEEELEKDGFIYTIPAKGCYVAPKNAVLLREENLKKIETLIDEAVKLAAACNLTKEELVSIFGFALDGAQLQNERL